MTELRPARPTLATWICVYEVVLLCVPRLIQWRLRALYQVPQYHAYPPHLLQSVLAWLGIGLAIAAVVALWRMRRVAFILFLGRFALSLVSLYRNWPRSVRTYRILYEAASIDGYYWPLIAAIAMMAVQWALNIAIVWYVYQITTSSRCAPTEPAAPEPTA